METQKQKFKLFPGLYGMVAAAILVAISVVGKVFAINLGESFRIGLENFPVILSGIMFGPITGFVVGVAADLLGCLAMSYAVNPLITLGMASLGAVAGIVNMFFKDKFSVVGAIIADILAQLVGSLLVKTLGIAIYYGAPDGYFMLFCTRVVTYLPVIILEIVLFVFMFSNKAFIKELSKL